MANTLLDTIEVTSECADLDAACETEVEPRIEDPKAGRAVAVPGEELRRDLLAMVDPH